MEFVVQSKLFFDDGKVQCWQINLYGDFPTRFKNVTSSDFTYCCSKEEGDKIAVGDIFTFQKK